MSEDRVEAVERALTILEAFREGEEALSLAALAEKTGFYKSTILRLAASLERFGYLAREPERALPPGPEPVAAGLALPAQLRSRRACPARAAPAGRGHDRDRLVLCPRGERAGLPLSPQLAARRCGIISTRVSGYLWSVVRPVGCSWPSTAAGRALRDDPPAGHYVSLGERDPEIAAASVPVLDAAGHIRGALSVSALLSRFDAEAQARALTALHQSAERLASHLPQD